jgi:hypothetical protein
MGYKGLEASFYCVLWERAYGFVNNISPVVEIDSGYSADVVLRGRMGRRVNVYPGEFNLSCVS